MSPYLHYEIARARQQEIVSPAIDSHRSHSRRTTVDRYRSVRHRLAPVVAALGVCVAAGSAVTVSQAHLNQPPITPHTGHVSAQQVAQEMRSWEAKGYVPAACTVSGTLLRNYSTRKAVTVKL